MWRADHSSPGPSLSPMTALHWQTHLQTCLECCKHCCWLAVPAAHWSISYTKIKIILSGDHIWDIIFFSGDHIWDTIFFLVTIFEMQFYFRWPYLKYNFLSGDQFLDMFFLSGDHFSHRDYYEKFWKYLISEINKALQEERPMPQWSVNKTLWHIKK